MDDFKEMIQIEEEFGALHFGGFSTRPKKKKVDSSVWDFIARKLDDPPAKFSKFIDSLKQYSQSYHAE